MDWLDRWKVYKRLSRDLVRVAINGNQGGEGPPDLEIQVSRFGKKVGRWGKKLAGLQKELAGWEKC